MFSDILVEQGLHVFLYFYFCKVHQKKIPTITLGHSQINSAWDHLCESKTEQLFVIVPSVPRQQSRNQRKAQVGAERCADELALHGCGTEPDSWHSDNDL